MNYTVKFKSGLEAIKGEHYIFNEKTKIFYYINNNLIIDFSNCNNITFNIWHNNILKCGNNCTIKCGYDNEFYLGKNCLVKDVYRDNIIHTGKPKCRVELIYGSKIINKFYISTKYKIKTNLSKIGFEIVK